MPRKPDPVEKAIKQAMPGWKVVKTKPASDATAAGAARAKPDAVAPGLAAQQEKLGVVKKSTKKSGTKKKTGHAKFVTVTPEAQPDNIRKFQKVVLVKDGKVVARQG